MWSEEFESTDSPSARPNTTNILERLQEEAGKWGPTNRYLAPPPSIERTVTGTSPTSPEGAHVGLTGVTAGSTADSYGFPDQLVWSPGLFTSRGFVKERVLTTISRGRFWGRSVE